MNQFPPDRRGWLIAVLAISVTATAALAVPVPLPKTDEKVRPAIIDGLSAAVAEVVADESPEALLASRRWGRYRPLPEAPAGPPPAPEAPSVPSLNPALVKMNYVGLITVREERTVLLASPKGNIIRYVPGDTLPDGRVLVSVTDNSISLKADGVPEEELLLFPSLGKREREPGNTAKRDRDVGASR